MAEGEGYAAGAGYEVDSDAVDRITKTTADVVEKYKAVAEVFSGINMLAGSSRVMQPFTSGAQELQQKLKEELDRLNGALDSNVLAAVSAMNEYRDTNAKNAQGQRQVGQELQG